MSVMTEVAVRLTEYLNEVLCPVEPLDRNTNLLAAGIVDSLMIIDLVEYMQDTHSITIEPHEINPQNFRSAQTLGDLVLSKLSEAPGLDPLYEVPN
jgi:acyl carrier protein